MLKFLQKIKEFLIRLFITGPAPMHRPVVQPVLQPEPAAQPEHTVQTEVKPDVVKEQTTTQMENLPEISVQQPSVNTQIADAIMPVVVQESVSEKPSRKKRAPKEENKIDKKPTRKTAVESYTKTKKAGNASRRTKSVK